MPSPYSSEGSVADADALARNLGIRFEVLPIASLFEDAKRSLAPVFAGRPEDVAEENVQSRLRGLLVMGFSNKHGALVLTTGNKSELATGYCTLYGDMCGGLAPISDLAKMRVYALARHLNARAGRALIPEASLEKPPSAELRPAQTDQDSLPPYPVLDAILEGLVERHLSVAAAARASGAPPSLVAKIARMMDLSEYKRRQAAPGKVSAKAFGIGRRVCRPESPPLSAALLAPAKYPWKGDPAVARRPSRGCGRRRSRRSRPRFGARHFAERIRPACVSRGPRLDPRGLRSARFSTTVTGDILRESPALEERSTSSSRATCSSICPAGRSPAALAASEIRRAPLSRCRTSRTSRCAPRSARALPVRRRASDRTHLRFYTRASARRLEESGSASGDRDRHACRARAPAECCRSRPSRRIPPPVRLTRDPKPVSRRPA